MLFDTTTDAIESVDKYEGFVSITFEGEPPYLYAGLFRGIAQFVHFDKDKDEISDFINFETKENETGSYYSPFYYRN